MRIRLSSVIGWICAGLVAALTLFSAVMAFVPVTNPEALEFAVKLGVAEIDTELAIAKIVITLLFLVPRTSTVGFVLMVGYYGGALATNITHGLTLAQYAPILIVFVLLTISAFSRHPELLTRLKGKPVVA